MDILNLNKISLFCFLFIFISCQTKKDEEYKLEQAKNECENKKSIEGIELYFFNYKYEEISRIDVEIRGTQKKTFTIVVPEKMIDSSRNQRASSIIQKISLNDTVVLNFKNNEKYFLSGFKYIVRPHFAMLSKNWGCDFYELKVNNNLQNGGVASFVKNENQ